MQHRTNDHGNGMMTKIDLCIDLLALPLRRGEVSVVELGHLTKIKNGAKRLRHEFGTVLDRFAEPLIELGGDLRREDAPVGDEEYPLISIVMSAEVFCVELFNDHVLQRFRYKVDGVLRYSFQYMRKVVIVVYKKHKSFSGKV